MRELYAILILAKEIPPNVVLSLTVLLTAAVMTFVALDDALRGSGQEGSTGSVPKMSAAAKGDEPTADLSEQALAGGSFQDTLH